MRVMEAERPGGPEVLRHAERAVPEPGPTEVLVRVRAAGLNPVDWKTRAGGGLAGLLGPAPWVLGWDVAGEVAAIGGGVTRFAVGDAVFGMPRFPHAAGAYGEFVAAPSRQFAHAPSAVGVVEAAALPLAALTVWQALIEAAALEKGQRVLVHAAAGGVGHLAVQLAKWRGAHVIGTASAGKHARLRELGVDEPVDYRERPFEEQVRDVDVVFDLVGGECTARSLAVLRAGGVLVCLPSTTGLPPADELERRGVRGIAPLVEPDGHALERIAALVDEGALRVDVAATAPLDRIADLHRLGEEGRTAGKLVAEV
ncbi:NADP-dependent oxidoreductase [Actinomycetes bacterium KLBMP 9759]